MNNTIYVYIYAVVTDHHLIGNFCLCSREADVRFEASLILVSPSWYRLLLYTFM